MSKIEKITKEEILGLKFYKSKKEKILNIGLRALFFVFVLVSLTYLFFRNVKNQEVKANPDCTNGVYTYACCTQGTNCWAYYGQDDYTSAPVLVNRALWHVAGTEFTSGKYDNIETSNDTRESLSEATNIRQNVHDFVMHITETPANITSLTLKWEGYAAQGSEAAAANDLRMYVYNVSTAAWVLVASYLDNSCSTSACETSPLTYTLTTITTPTIVNSIDGSGNLRFMVQKYEGACTTTCYGPDASGTCVAQTTTWGAGTYGCTGSTKRCNAGSCVTCGGWVAADGLGGYACWYNGGKGTTCDSVCTGHGGCVSGNWNDNSSCTVCKHWNPTLPCYNYAVDYFPAKQDNGLGDPDCDYRTSGAQNCAGHSTYAYRFCNCGL